jgi:DNA-binding MarR family transcriptional regulator
MNATDMTSTLKDPLEDFLGYQLRRAAFATLTPLVEAFAELGVNPTEAIALRFVRANPGCTQADIGRAIGVKRTNMVPVVTGLMAKGLLERTPADGRSNSLYLTKEGGELHRRITKVALEHEQFFFGDVTDPARQVLMQAFRTLRAKGELWDARERAAGSEPIKGRGVR